MLLSTVDVADLTSGVTTTVLAGQEQLLTARRAALRRAGDAPTPRCPTCRCAEMGRLTRAVVARVHGSRRRRRRRTVGPWPPAELGAGRELPLDPDQPRRDAVTLAEGPIAVLAALTGVAVRAGRSAGPAAARWRRGGDRPAPGLVGAYDDLCRGRSGQGLPRSPPRAPVRHGDQRVDQDRRRRAQCGRRGDDHRTVHAGSARRLVDVGLDTALIAGTANLINLLDLRPGPRREGDRRARSAGLVGHGSAPVVGAAAGQPAERPCRTVDARRLRRERAGRRPWRRSPPTRCRGPRG